LQFGSAVHFVAQSTFPLEKDWLSTLRQYSPPGPAIRSYGTTVIMIAVVLTTLPTVAVTVTFSSVDNAAVSAVARGAATAVAPGTVISVTNTTFCCGNSTRVTGIGAVRPAATAIAAEMAAVSAEPWTIAATSAAS